jgi:hypothetical protein
LDQDQWGRPPHKEVPLHLEREREREREEGRVFFVVVGSEWVRKKEE